MVRERVISIFFGLLIFTLAIFLIQLNTEQGFTGSIVSDFKSNIINNSLDGQSFSLKIDEYSFKNGQLTFSYIAEDNSGEDHNLEINYFIHDEAVKVFKSGKENVLLDKDKSMKYLTTLSLENIEESNIYLTVLASDGKSESRARVILDLPHISITGGAIKEQKATAANYFGVMLLALVILFYCIKAVYSYRVKKKMTEYRSDRFIPVHH